VEAAMLKKPCMVALRSGPAGMLLPPAPGQARSLAPRWETGRFQPWRQQTNLDVAKAARLQAGGLMAFPPTSSSAPEQAQPASPASGILGAGGLPGPAAPNFLDRRCEDAGSDQGTGLLWVDPHTSTGSGWRSPSPPALVRPARAGSGPSIPAGPICGAPCSHAGPVAAGGPSGAACAVTPTTATGGRWLQDSGAVAVG